MYKRWVVPGGIALFLLVFGSVAVVAPSVWRSWSRWNAGYRSSHVRKLVAAPDGSYIDARWSPDGQWIAAVARREHDNGRLEAHILLLRPDGSLVHEVPAPDGVDAVSIGNALAWHPDGTLTVVADLTTSADIRQPVPPPRTALFQLDPFRPEQPPQLIQKNLAPISSLDWSPDGKLLLLSQEVGPRIPPVGVRDIGLVVYDHDAQTFDTWQHHDTGLSRPRWRPDGKTVLYQVQNYDPHNGLSQNDLMLAPWPAGAVQRVTKDGCMFDAIDWSPHGTAFVYRETCTGYQWGEQTMRVATLDAPLTSTQVCDDHVFFHADWGPDNQMLGLIAEYPGATDLYVCTIEPIR